MFANAAFVVFGALRASHLFQLLSESSGQDLSSPGSCLLQYVEYPIIRCTAGTCWVATGDKGLWLGADMDKDASVCSVCIKV